MKLYCSILLGAVIAFNSAHAGEKDVIDFVAKESERSMDLAHQLAPLKSASDVYQYIQHTPKGLSPLSALPNAQRDEFTQSLRFNDRGLSQFDYTVLQSLSPTQVYKILALFGMQGSTGLVKAKPISQIDRNASVNGIMAEFLVDYRCIGEHSCMSAIRMACTSNC